MTDHLWHVKPDDFERAYEMVVDPRDPQALRTQPIPGEHAGNLTLLDGRHFYVTRRVHDPLVHVTSGYTSMTGCGYRVVSVDDVRPGSPLDVTCLGCTVYAGMYARYYTDES